MCVSHNLISYLCNTYKYIIYQIVTVRLEKDQVLRAESGAMMYMTDGGEIFICAWVM